MSESKTVKVLYLSFGKILTTVVSILTGMVAARLLSLHDYGTMRQTLLAYSFVATFLLLGIPDSLYYFLPKEHRRKKGLILDALVLLFFLAACFSVFLILGGNRILSERFNNPDLEITLKWMSLYPLYVMPPVILASVLITHNKTLVLTKYNVITSFILFSAVIAGILITKTYAGPLIVQVLFPLVLFPYTLFLIFKFVPGYITSPSFKSIISILKYSIPLGLSATLGTLAIELGKVIVSSICTPEEYAIYSNGAIEIPVVGIITVSVSSVILVDLTKLYNQNKIQDALSLFHISAIRTSAIIFPAFCFLLVMGKVFILLLYSEKYLNSIAIFYVMLFVLPTRIVMYGSVLMSAGRTRIILFRSVIDLLCNLILSIILVRFLGYIGAAIATVITFYVWTTPFNIYQISRIYKINPINVLPLRKLAIIMGLSLACSLVILLLKLFIGEMRVFYFLSGAIIYSLLISILFIRMKFIILPEMIYYRIPLYFRQNLLKI